MTRRSVTVQDGADAPRTVVLDAAAVVSVARAELGRLTGRWHALLATHEPDERGRCPECSSWVRRRRWPCDVWLTAHQLLLAERARRRREQRRRRASGGTRKPTVVVRRAPHITVAPSAPVPAADAAPGLGQPPLEIQPVIHRAAVVDRAAG